MRLCERRNAWKDVGLKAREAAESQDRPCAARHFWRTRAFAALWLVVAYGLCALLHARLERAGVYRAVWHRALFDLALFVCLLGGVVYLSSEYLS